MFEKKEFNFKKYGAFFAFGIEQFEEQKDKNKKNSDYVSLDMGLVALKENYKKMLEDLDKHSQNEIERRKKEMGKEAIIKYELSNYEAYYTGDLTDTIDALEGYGYSEEDIRKVFTINLEKSN